MIYFIGAGPGAVDLITVKGKELLEKADLIIYAGSLVNPELLKYAKPDCVIMDSAKMTLEEVIAAMVPAAQAGKLVVRLHTGDPSIYGAHREQIDLLRSYGLDYDCSRRQLLLRSSGCLKSRIHSAECQPVGNYYPYGRPYPRAAPPENCRLRGAQRNHGYLFKQQHAG